MTAKHALLLFAATVALTVLVLFIAFALIQAAQAWADPPPSTPPTPGPVVNTGGAGSGTSPGSSCSTHLGVRNQPYTPSGTYTWAQSGDSGWPFGWPGMPWITPPTAAPSVGCSR